MTRRRLLYTSLAACGLIAAVTGVSLGQPPWFRGGRTPGVMPADRAGVPDWKIDPAFRSDVFTFVRLEYDSYGRGGGRGRGWGRGGGWATDWPDSDLNLSFRLQQLTSLKVNPDPITLRVTDPKVFNYPFLYMIEPGALSFSEEEVVALRKYLFNGGFLMVDDFWGDWQWDNFYTQIKRVFPDQEPQELPLDHPIFNIVYRLKERPQVPSIHTWAYSGETYENHGPGSEQVHYRALYDDKGRMVVLACHNTDLGDGWEREGEDPSYFKEFSEKKSYPMGINIITYAMTH
ncbi:MAG: DUF4159 domain-containing protein [Isosphaeraceae bacterium]